MGAIMRLFTFAAWVLAASQAAGVLAAAPVSQDAVPQCGMSCITNEALDSTCLLGNITCICSNVELNERISLCIHQNCTKRESLLVQRFSKQQCNVPSRDRTALVRIIGVVFLALGLLAFFLRVIARLFLDSQTWGADDWVLLFAVALMIPLNVLSIPISDIALGQDIWNVEPDNVTKFLYYFFWDELLYLSALPVTKISILLFYLRVFPRRQTQIACWVLIGFNVAFFIVWQIITIFQCKPIPGAWKVWDGEFKAKCNNINIQGWAAAAVTILLDLATLILPLPELWKLNLSFTKKVQALMMFSVGSFVTIVSVVRLQSLTTYATTQNITQDYAEVGYWSTIEVPVGIICACMPAIRSLLVRAFPRTFGTTKDQSNYANVSNQSKITSSTQKNISRVSTQQGVAVQSEWPKYQQEEQRMELADMNQKGPIRPLRPVRPASSVHTEDLDYRHYYEEDEEYFAPMPHGGHANRNNYNYNDHSNYSLPHVGRTPSRKGRTYFEDV